jgi:hypothetical protein
VVHLQTDYKITVHDSMDAADEGKNTLKQVSGLVQTNRYAHGRRKIIQQK